MQAIRNKDTKAEKKLAKALWTKGHRYRKNNKSVFGIPDLTFKKIKLAIFVDSEFFHGRDWETKKHRIRTNQSFWWSKIEGNIKRDKTVFDNLTFDGWKVLRFWDTEVHKNLGHCITKIERTIKTRKNAKKIF